MPDQANFKRQLCRDPEWCYVQHVKSLVYLTTHIPSKLVVDLEAAGYYVYEAFEVSEVLHLCEHHDIAAVVIGADVADADVIELQMRRITIRLKPQATGSELVWELSNLFPDHTIRIQ